MSFFPNIISKKICIVLTIYIWQSSLFYFTYCKWDYYRGVKFINSSSIYIKMDFLLSVINLIISVTIGAVMWLHEWTTLYLTLLDTTKPLCCLNFCWCLYFCKNHFIAFSDCSGVIILLRVQNLSWEQNDGFLEVHSAPVNNCVMMLIELSLQHKFTSKPNWHSALFCSTLTSTTVDIDFPLFWPTRGAYWKFVLLASCSPPCSLTVLPQ